jgi:hypothetical protein
MNKLTNSERYKIILEHITRYEETGKSVVLKASMEDCLKEVCPNEKLVIKKLISALIYKDELQEYYFAKNSKENQARDYVGSSGEISKNKNTKILELNNLSISELREQSKLLIKREYGFLCKYAELASNTKKSGSISNLTLFNISKEGLYYNFSWATEKEFKLEAINAIAFHVKKTFNAVREILYQQGVKDITWSAKDTD